MNKWVHFHSCLRYEVTRTHTHTRLTARFSKTTRVSRYRKGKTNLDFTEARDSEWRWHQLGNMQVCTLLQTNNTPAPHHSVFFTGRMPFLPPNQQRQSTESRRSKHEANVWNIKKWFLHWSQLGNHDS